MQRRECISGAYPNFQDNRSKTTLMVAVAYGPPDVVQLLLAKGANPIQGISDVGKPVIIYSTLLNHAQSRPDGKDKTAVIRMLKQAEHAKHTGE